MLFVQVNGELDEFGSLANLNFFHFGKFCTTMLFWVHELNYGLITLLSIYFHNYNED